MAVKRHMSSLQRGLNALRILNLVDRITTTELGRRLGVPRTTAYRILDTLVAEGYVVREAHSRGYQLTVQVRRLSFGFNRDALIADVARPILREMCGTLFTPIGLATPVRHEIVIQVSLDFEAPLALERLPEGTSFPVTYGPSGHLFLAHCDPELRRDLIEGAAHAASSRGLTIQPVPMNADLKLIRERGYALSIRHDSGSPEGILAVPVYLQGAFVASVHLRFMKRVISPGDALTRFLADLQDGARRIERELEHRLLHTPQHFEQFAQPLRLSPDAVRPDAGRAADQSDQPSRSSAAKSAGRVTKLA